ncbi:MAG: PKD domain-containing protein [Bacteroidales bacterium]|nr:PKD domain-containing protein [Bacteroidales bacterium]
MKKFIVLTGLVIFIFSCGEKNEIIKPAADFEMNIITNSVPAYIEFQNNSSNATDYIWDFGDGGLSIDYSPNYIYLAQGNYLVTLKAFGEGGKDTLTKEISIEAPKNTFYKVQNTSSVTVSNVRSFHLDWDAGYLYDLIEHDDMNSNDISDAIQTTWNSIEVMFELEDKYCLLAFPESIEFNSTTTISITDTSSYWEYDVDPIGAESEALKDKRFILNFESSPTLK